MPTLKYISLIIVLPLFISCSSKTLYLENAYQKTRASSTGKLSKKECDPACSFNIVSIEDKRRNKNHLGRVSRNLIVDEDIHQWLKSGFLSLQDNGFTVMSQNKDMPFEKNFIKLSIQLKLAYAHTLSTSTSANIVLKIIYENREGFIQTKLYRGNYTDINWFGSQNETNDSFNHAFQEILDSVSSDMEMICNNKQLNPNLAHPL